MESLLEIINEVLSSNGEKPLESINLSTNLRDDIGFSSFDLAELTVRVEEKFGVDIFANGIVNTVGEIYKQLEGL